MAFVFSIRMTGICFGTKSSILRLDIPDNPSKPCLSCTKQWCLNQNLPICAGASLGDTDPDTATGKEGDVEARCFRMYTRSNSLGLANLTMAHPRTRLAPGPAGRHFIPSDRVWSLTGSGNQGEDDQGGFGYQLALEYRSQVVAGACTSLSTTTYLST